MPKTIAAISTPQAAGGIGIVRISGPEARAIAGRVFTSARGKTLEQCRGYTALYGRVHDAEGEIDEAIALNFIAPASFTGEDVVELSCHGGIYVMRRVLQAVFAAGAAPAGPGEFTRRAFLNGKIGLTEAESVMQIISAQGLEAGKAAMAGRDGALERRIIQIREGLTTIAAHLDAWADYPDEDIPEVDGSGLQESLEHAAQELDRLLSQFEAGRGKVGKKGVVRDPAVHREVLEKAVGYALSSGFSPLGLTYSPVKGPEGNIEYLLYLRREAQPRAGDLPDISELVE